MPSPSTAPRQPTRPMVSAAANPTTTVPTLPPATWTAIALPSRLGGNCSASRALPTGCCGAPPMRETRFATANGGNELAAAWSAVPAPVTRPPLPSTTLRLTRRVIAANVYWSRPLAMLPMVDRITIGRRGDPELVDDREVDQRVQRRLPVDQRVLDGQQREGDAGSHARRHVRRSLHASSVAWAAAARGRQSRAATRRVPSTLVQANPLSFGMGALGSSSARSHAADDAG